MIPPCPVVVLASGSGTLLQALIQACADPAYGVRIAAVGADRSGTGALERADAAGLPAFVRRVGDHPDRATWDRALAGDIQAHLPGREPRWVVTAGFMKLLGPAVLSACTVLNSHPALLPAFPGAHAVRDALAHGVRVTGTTVHVVDEGIDTGPIIAQRAVPVRADDTEETLHERIKVVERDLLVRIVHRALTGGLARTDRKVLL